MPPRKRPAVRTAPPTDAQAKAARRAQSEKVILDHKKKALMEATKAAAAAAANARMLEELEAQAADERSSDEEPAHDQATQATQFAELKRRSTAQEAALLDVQKMLRRLTSVQGNSAAPLDLLSPRAVDKRARPTSARTPGNIDDEDLDSLDSDTDNNLPRTSRHTRNG